MNNHIRPLGAMEKLFWLLDQSGSVHFIMAAEIIGKRPLTQWQSALNAVQRKHPLLSASININGYVHPFFQSEENANIPLRKVTKESIFFWEDEVVKELSTPFDAGKAPLVRAVLVEADHKTIVILTMHHSIGDGLSGLVIINDLLHSLDGQQLLALKVPEPAETYLGIVQRVNARSEPYTVITRKSEDKPIIERLQLSATFTSQLSECCRKEGTTVHAALCAAFIFAGRNIDNEWTSKPVRLVSPASIRKELNAGDVVAEYITSRTIVYPIQMKESFWELARFSTQALAGITLRQNITTAINGVTQLIFSEKNTKEIVSDLQQGIAREIMITNLGRYPYPVHFDDLRLDAVWGPAVLSGFRGDQTIGVTTTNGAMGLMHTSRIPIKGLLAMAEKILEDAIHTIK